MLLVRACGAETFVPWTLLERAGVSCLFMLELNFHSGSSIYSSQWFACLASHTSRSNSPVAHPSYSFPFQMRLTSRSDCYRVCISFVCHVRRLSACGYVMLLPPPKLQAIAPRVFVMGEYVDWSATTCVVLYWSYTCYAWRADWFKDSLEMELCFAISFLGWTFYHDIEYCWIA
ncbi:hypothetical protein DY000_02038703 [Brassica cretica]|uniref:Uncharacterized protein n=1 Tax=Brassica cretica TaxID=69181 RepID=A0ABQ7BNM4_BRACR|nr:hypothetical protein DY000_02038703 [Brassica cretica]